MNLEKLFKEEKYFEIMKYYEAIKNPEDLKNPEDIYYIIMSYFFNGWYEKALNVLTRYKDILLKDNTRRTFDLHLSLLDRLEDVDGALKAIEEYKSLPYISYEMEELYKETEEAYMKRKYKPKAKKEEKNFHSLLLSNSFDDQLAAITLLYDEDIRPYVTVFKLLLEDKNTSPIIQSFILMLLLAKKDDNEYVVNKLDLAYRIVPYELEPIINRDMIYDAIYEYIEKEDLNFSDFMEFILMRYALIIYPEPLLIYEDETLIYASILLVKEMLGQEKDKIYEEITRKLLNIDTINKVKGLLDTLINEKPTTKDGKGI